jgi:hypothetical protein
LTMLATRTPLQDGFTVIKKAIDIVGDAAAVPRCTVQYFGPTWLLHRSMKRRPEHQSDFVDALPLRFVASRVKFIARTLHFRETATSQREPRLKNYSIT